MPDTEAGHSQRDGSVPPALSYQPQGQYQQNSRFMSVLPLDSILNVFDVLEAHDAIALSLSCKGLHHHLFAAARSRFENASREGKRKVRTMLERTLPPNQIYCPFCRIFHTLDNNYRRTSCLESQEPRAFVIAGQVPGILTHKMKYLDARSLMNAVTFKRQLPNKFPKSSGRVRKLVVGPDDNFWIHGGEAKVVRGELFTKTTSMHLRRHATSANEKFTYRVCRHLQIPAQFPRMWITMFALKRINTSTEEGDRAAMGACPTCHAEWYLRIEFEEDAATGIRDSWAMVIDSWHCLGSMRSPTDPIWTRAAGESTPAERRWAAEEWHCIDIMRTRNWIDGPRMGEVGPLRKLWDFYQKCE